MNALLLLLVGLPLFGDGSVSGEVTVTLGMEAIVRGTEVELGQVGLVEATDPTVVHAIEAVSLGYAPAPGYSRLFRTDVIERTVKRKYPKVILHFKGQAAIRVYPKVETIQPEAVIAEAHAALAVATGSLDANFTQANHIEAIKIPEGTVGHSLRARLDGRPVASGSISVPVDVMVDGTRYRTVWTTWKMQAFETRQVLARGVQAGERLDPRLFERRRVEVLRGEKPGLAPSVLVGAVALRDLSPGAVVTALDVHRPVVVVVGESIFLRVRKGTIEARVSAIALESGAVGDRIRVRTQGSSTKLVATVQSRDVCSIDLGH